MVPVNGALGYYVTSDGRVLSDYYRGGHGYSDTARRHELVPTHKKYGHCAVTLRYGSTKSRRHVHRLVAEHFIGPPPFNGAIVMHIDGNARNNVVDNLKWGTPAENAQSSADLDAMPYGEAHHNAKLTDDLVRWARAEYARGGRLSDIATTLRISYSNAYYMLTRRTWRRVA